MWANTNGIREKELIVEHLTETHLIGNLTGAEGIIRGRRRKKEQIRLQIEEKFDFIHILIKIKQ